MVVYCKYSYICTLAINSWLAYMDNDGNQFLIALLKRKSLPGTFLPHLLKDLDLDLISNKLRYFANSLQCISLNSQLPCPPIRKFPYCYALSSLSSKKVIGNCSLTSLFPRKDFLTHHQYD